MRIVGQPDQVHTLSTDGSGHMHTRPRIGAVFNIRPAQGPMHGNSTNKTERWALIRKVLFRRIFSAGIKSIGSQIEFKAEGAVSQYVFPKRHFSTTQSIHTPRFPPPWDGLSGNSIKLLHRRRSRSENIACILSDPLSNQSIIGIGPHMGHYR